MEKKNNSGCSFLSGAALGVGAMYFLDPSRGRRRRALVRDKAVHYTRVFEDYCGKLGRHYSNKLKGFLIEVDKKLEARIKERETRREEGSPSVH